MKIYVDEMPKSCIDCEQYTENHTENYGRGGCCIAKMPFYNTKEDRQMSRGQHKDSISDWECPLHSLAEHDAELLRNAIVPKFKKCQKVWAVYCDNEILKGQIDTFDVYEKSYLIYFEEKDCGWDYGNEWIPENLVFATKAEAEAKLKELQGENNERTRT